MKLLEREEVRPRLLKEVEEFINKVPLAEFSTCPEDKLSGCLPEILEHVLQYLPPRDLKSAVLTNKKLYEVGGKPKFWADVKVSPQFLESAVTFTIGSSGLDNPGFHCIGFKIYTVSLAFCIGLSRTKCAPLRMFNAKNALLNVSGNTAF